MKNSLLIAACASMALGSFGCSNTVRYMTATHWTSPGGGTSAAPAASGDAAAGAPAAPAAASSNRVLYITYWEGSCSGGVLGFGKGCSKGDSQVRRCNVQADNSLTCVDEKEMGKALSTSN